jgi:hypothetical protein
MATAAIVLWNRVYPERPAKALPDYGQQADDKL